MILSRVARSIIEQVRYVNQVRLLNTDLHNMASWQEVISVKFREDGVAIMTFQNGKNEFTMPFVQNVTNALDHVLSNNNVRALVTTNAEGKHFSNGIKMTTFSQPPDEIKEFMEAFHSMLWKLITFPVPTIAAMNGHAFAGGAFLALAHDFRVMNSERGWFCLPEIHLGMMFSALMMDLLRLKLPAGPVFTDLVVLGARYPGEKAMQTGVVQAVAPPTGVVDAAVEQAKAVIARGDIARSVMSGMKEDVYGILMNNVTFTPKL